MSPNQDKRKEESHSAGDYPETQPSEQSTDNSNRATQGSHDSPSTSSGQAASPDGHLDLEALAEEPASDAVQDWPLDERPAPVDAVPVMEARIAVMMASYRGHGAADGAHDNNTDTEDDPTPPSDG